MEDQVVFYVLEDKTWGRANALPQGAYPIDEHTYNLLEADGDCLELSFVDGTLHIAVSLISYKRKALPLVALTVNNYRSADQILQELRDCVIAETSYFDSSNGNILDASEAKDLFVYLVNRHNEFRRISYTYENMVRKANSAEEIDSLLESLDKTLKGIP